MYSVALSLRHWTPLRPSLTGRPSLRMKHRAGNWTWEPCLTHSKAHRGGKHEGQSCCPGLVCRANAHLGTVVLLRMKCRECAHLGTM